MQFESLKFRELNMIRVLENRVLGMIFGSKREEVSCDWRTLHDEEFNGM